ncbi:TIR domain-containing protein [Pricia sp. S334]|uniref:TIR domain-containing protein n=1 Tax=Pricia mediterranea TaxID=3076079 RepID=A0ABU3L2I2_9FLAO|nr:TIR domain-containing protein [Pricia sp. S334]MDT7827394.1 TIR domain-containing protein [Pricia sp. S334]
MDSTKNIFAIYASQDKDILQYLLLHLQPLEKDFNISIWSDDAINRGQPWKPRNVSRLDHTDVFLFLVSNTFMCSEFIRQDEFKMVIDCYKDGKAVIIPIILDDCPWDAEFTFDDYTFNFKELQVFHKDENQIGDWHPTHKTFTQVSYYLRGLLASSTRKSAVEEPANKAGKKIRNTKKEEQITIDFFGEREAKNKAEWEGKREQEAEAKKRVEEKNKLSEEAEAKEVIRKEKRLRQKAEIQKRIEKEKRLREKSKKDRKIDEEFEDKNVVQKESPGHEEAKAKVAEEGKGRGETTRFQSETEQEKELEKIVTARPRTTKKNGLARYNYQFKTAKTVEPKREVQKEGQGDKEVKARVTVEQKKGDKQTKPQRGTEREKELSEIVAAQRIIAKKSGLARYNYRFKTTKMVEAKRAVQKERQTDEETKAKSAGEQKRRFETTMAQKQTELKRKLAELLAALKRVLKKNRSVVQDYQVKYAKAIEAKRAVQEEARDVKEVKDKVEVERKKRFETIVAQRQNELKKRLTEILAALKRVLKKNRSAAQDYQVKYAKAIDQYYKEAKKNINTTSKRRVHAGFLVAAVVLGGIFIYLFTGDSQKQSNTIVDIEQAEVGSDPVVNAESDTENQAGAILELGVGDIYKNGIIFAIDAANEKGKIAYTDDLGPMTWNEAMNIHEHLGEGWRVPTMDELRLMYNTIGQGADNKGGFADELYWSATPFDDYQARLLRFSDGNDSYHYNSSGTFREFRVRAIKDFTR